MDIPYCPHSPTERQRSWLHNRDKSYTYMCGRGGGKSVALLMAALQDISVPGYRAVIFYGSTGSRRWWLDELDRWWEDDPTLRYLSDGAWMFPHGSKLYMHVLPRGVELSRYRSAIWDFIGFEDVDGYGESDLPTESILARRARAPGSRVRATYSGYDSDEWDVVNPWVTGK